MQKGAFQVLHVAILPADLSSLAIISLPPLAAQPDVGPKEDGTLSLPQIDASWAHKLQSALAGDSSLRAVLLYKGEHTMLVVLMNYCIRLH